VEILNPYNEREFLDDKLSIVDVKARDALGRLYQVEIRILVHADLPARMLYAWADLYSQQLHSGQDYRELRPTYALWLLGDYLLRDDPAYAHRYRLRDERGRTLLEHGGISPKGAVTQEPHPIPPRSRTWRMRTSPRILASSFLTK